MLGWAGEPARALTRPPPRPPPVSVSCPLLSSGAAGWVGLFVIGFLLLSPSDWEVLRGMGCQKGWGQVTVVGQKLPVALAPLAISVV